MLGELLVGKTTGALSLGMCFGIYFGICFGICVVLRISGFEYIRNNRILLMAGMLFFLLGCVCGAYNEKKKEVCTFSPGDKVSFSGIVVNRYRNHEGRYRIRTGQINDNRVHTYVIIETEIELDIGCRVYGEGVFEPFMMATNYGQFDENGYETANGNLMQLKKVDITYMEKTLYSFLDYLEKINFYLCDLYDKWLPEDKSSLAKAMVLGDKADIDKNLKALYQRSGIAHIIAISGLHIAMFGGTFYRIIRKVTGSFTVAAFAGITFIVLYGLLTGLSGATVRAMIMLILLIVSEVLGRKYDAITSVMIALFLMLIWTLEAYCQVGFLLSFGAVIGISVINPILERCFEDVDFLSKLSEIRVLGFGRLAAGKKEQDNKEPGIKVRGRSWAAFLCRKVWDGLLISISVQLVILPVLFYYFYEVPVYGLMINIVVVPLMGVLLAMLVLLSISGLFGIPGTGICSFIACRIFDIYEMLCKLADGMPFHTINFGRPESWWIWFYYIILASLLIGLWKHNRFVSRVSFVIFIIVLVIPLCDKRLVINFFDVGQGDGIYIRTPSKESVLIDGGSSSKKKVGTYIIKNGVKYYGSGMIDYMIVTHSDSDHYSGLLEMLTDDEVVVNNFVLPGIDEPDEAYLDLVNAAKDKGCRLYFLKSGDRMIIGDVIFHCLNPGNNLTADKNENSIVLWMQYGLFDALFTGDIDDVVEQKLLSNESFMGSIRQGNSMEVLKVAHHGSATSSCKEFLRNIGFDVSVISVGEHNRYGHPAEEAVDRLKEYCGRIYMTKDSGAVAIRTDGKRYEVTTYMK